MRFAVFTPTRQYGGLDVTASCLERQIMPDGDLLWIIGDDLYAERESVVAERTSRLQFDVVHLDSARYRRENPKYYRTLAHSYNEAIEIAVKRKFDVFVTLQDYIWVPEDGLKRYETALWLEKRGLYSGVTHHSDKPTPDDIFDSKGLWTCFEREWNGQKPEGISWRDGRLDEARAAGVWEADAMWWETNWAAVSVDILREYPQLRFPPEYDLGVAYENQYVSLTAAALSIPTYFDSGNVAISMRHKDFFPWQVPDEVKHLNARMHHERFGIPIADDMDAFLRESGC